MLLFSQFYSTAKLINLEMLFLNLIKSYTVIFKNVQKFIIRFQIQCA